MCKAKFLTSLLILSAALCLPVYAQVAGGSVSGRITDASGANVPDVRVELENLDTGQRIAATTDTSGNYSFTNVPAGRYRVITTGGRSQPAPSQEIAVEATRASTINITIPLGPGADALVSTEEVPVTTRPASIQETWNTRYIEYLPQSNFIDRQGTNFGAYNLATLTGGTVSSAPGARGGLAIAGERPDTSLFHIDGIDNRNVLTGNPLTYLSNEATSEFSVLENQNSPLFGQTSGPQYNSIMRTGANKAHGSIYDFLQNSWFNAVDRAWKPFGFSENNQPRFDQNRLGASIGTPIIAGKVFFFGNFEYIPTGFQGPVGGFITAPTAAGFAALANNPRVSTSNLGILQNGLGNNIPSTANSFTFVNGTATPLGLVNNNQRNWQNQLNGSAGLDFNLSEKDQFRFRYVHNDVDRSFSGASLAGFNTPSFTRSLLASAAHYHTFGNAITNELRLGFNRVDAEQYFPNGISPAIGIGGGLNLGLSPFFGQTGIVNTWHLADGLNFRIRGHQLKAGIDFRRHTGFSDNFGAFAGNYQYSTLERFLLDLSPDVAATRAFGNTHTDLGQYLWFGYLQDTWMMRPGFTLDLGVRYQYAQTPQAFRNQGLNSSFNVPGLINFSSPGSSWNIAPFVGVAISPWQSHTVVRAGFGMYYDATYLQPFGTGFAPQLTQLATGNLISTTPNFLAGGGLQNSGATSPASLGVFLQNQRMPYSMQWNVAVQQAIWRKSTIEIKYLGNRGVRQPVFSQLNYNGVTAANSLPLFNAAPTQAQLNALPLTLTALQNQTNAFTLAGFTSPLNTVTFDGNSWYNAAVVTLNHQFTGGFQLNANYTWSRWESDSTGTPLDIGMAQRMRSWSPWDRRHQANVTGLFEVAPLFKNTWSVVRNVFADFNLSGSYNYSIGGSLTPVAGINSALANNAFGTSVIPTGNTSGGYTVSGVTPLVNSGGQVVAYQAVNPGAAFIQPGPGMYATPSIGGIRLPDIHNIDVAAVKRFNFRERASFELRGEAYNLFNHPQPGATGFRSLSSPMMSLGPIPGTIDVNNLQNLQLLPSNPRTLQFALRINF